VDAADRTHPKMTQNSAPTVKQVLDAAEQAMRRGETRGPAIWLKRVRESAPLHPRAQHLLGLIHHLQGCADLSIRALRTSLLLRPGNAMAATQLGILLKRQSKDLENLRIQEQAAAIWPTDAAILNNLGNALSEGNLLSRAAEVFEKALASAPGDTTIYANLAAVLVKLVTPTAATRTAKQAILLGPGEQSGYLSLSAVLCSVKNDAVGKRILDLATCINPFNHDLLANKTRLSLRAGCVYLALRCARRGMTAYPDSKTLTIRHGAAALEFNLKLHQSWRWLLALNGKPPNEADNFSIHRVCNSKDLMNPEKRPIGITVASPKGPLRVGSPDLEDSILTVRDAIVMPRSQSIITSQGAILHEGLSPFTNIVEFGTDAEILHWNSNGHAVLRTETPTDCLTEAILLGMGGNGNYYHWLIDFVPRLYTIRRHALRHGPLAKVPLLLSDRCPATIVDLLGYLGVEKRMLTVAPEGAPVAVDKLYVPSLPSLGLASLGRSIRHDNELLAPHIEKWSTAGVISDSPERVYISRIGAAQRRVVNEAEVCQLLRKWGFTIITPDTSDIRQQIASLAKAKIFVSAHGAGLANMRFAPAGCQVIEFTYRDNPPEHIQRLASACGHRYHTIFCTALADPIIRPGKWNIRVPIDRLEATLRSIEVSKEA
jgi:capsular polysaccharide biosynthesis protein/Flp pilus assembly protein TadD